MVSKLVGVKTSWSRSVNVLVPLSVLPYEAE